MTESRAVILANEHVQAKICANPQFGVDIAAIFAGDNVDLKKAVTSAMASLEGGKEKVKKRKREDD